MSISITNPQHNYLRHRYEDNNLISYEQIRDSYNYFPIDWVEVLAFTTFGAFVGGWSLENNNRIFNLKGVFYGSLIFGSSAVIKTTYEAIIGFAIYHNQGAFVGLIAGTSIKASIGAGASLIAFKSYKAVLCGAIAGFFIDGMINMHEDIIYNYSNLFNDTSLLGSSAKIINYVLGEDV
jgi:hypothetical protein